jgi:hemerythrin-like domain-containing protein
MALVTQPLRDEHRELLPLLERVREAADGIESGSAAMEAVDSAYKFLSAHLLPHATAEEAALYPVVARVMGSPDATKTMQVDHAEVKRLTEELGEIRTQISDPGPSPSQARDLRRVLYGLYTLVGVHFAKEESVYLPLLDSRLSAEEARSMFEDMEAAAARAKQS